jgi:hypothetical protein
MQKRLNDGYLALDVFEEGLVRLAGLFLLQEVLAENLDSVQLVSGAVLAESYLTHKRQIKVRIE